jgi:hypothetical protein
MSIFSDLPSSDNENADNTFELNTTKALKPAEYNKVDLEEYVFSEKHKHISDEGEAKLLACFKLNKACSREGKESGKNFQFQLK